MGDETVRIACPGFDDQGRLGALLREVLGPPLEEAQRRARAAGLPAASVEDELMAADDFHFSSVPLMDCCLLAKTEDGTVVGAATVNPFLSALAHVAVLPAYRRRGIGRRLVEGARQILEQQGCDHVKADVPAILAEAGACAFLEAVGLREAERTVRMAAALSPDTPRETAPDEDED